MQLLYINCSCCKLCTYDVDKNNLKSTSKTVFSCS